MSALGSVPFGSISVRFRSAQFVWARLSSCSIRFYSADTTCFGSVRFDSIQFRLGRCGLIRVRLIQFGSVLFLFGLGSLRLGPTLGSVSFLFALGRFLARLGSSRFLVRLIMFRFHFFLVVSIHVVYCVFFYCFVSSRFISVYIGPLFSITLGSEIFTPGHFGALRFITAHFVSWWLKSIYFGSFFKFVSVPFEFITIDSH